VNGLRSCSCAGFRYRRTCRHLQLSPTERRKEKAIASKIGKQVAKGLQDAPGYASVSDKAKANPALADFLNNLADSL